MPLQIQEIGTIVVFTNDMGGGLLEIQAPENTEATFQMHAPGTVTAAWYYASDAIEDLAKIHRIRCEPKGTHVNIVVSGLPKHADARVQIKVLAAFNT